MEKLEQELRSFVSTQDFVLFMDRFPVGYLMTEAQHCTFTTWSTGYNDWGNPVSKLPYYFEIVEKIPDKIVYVYTGRYKVLSIDDPTFAFNDFVNENYTLIYRNDDSDYPVRIYEIIETAASG